MRKGLAITLVVLLFCGVAAALHAKERWIPVARTSGEGHSLAYSIDKSTFRGGERPIFWLAAAVCPLDESKKCGDSKIRIKGVCKDRLYVVISTRNFDADGQLVSSDDYGDEKQFRSAAPESTMEHILDFACTQQKKILAK